MSTRVAVDQTTYVSAAREIIACEGVIVARGVLANPDADPRVRAEIERLLASLPSNGTERQNAIDGWRGIPRRRVLR